MSYGQCFLCGKWGQLETHHIFGGANRKRSQKYKLTVALCGIECHRESKKSVHRCKETAQQLHEFGQRKFMEEQGATVEDFRKLFGKSYI